MRDHRDGFGSGFTKAGDYPTAALGNREITRQCPGTRIGGYNLGCVAWPQWPVSSHDVEGPQRRQWRPMHAQAAGALHFSLAVPGGPFGGKSRL